ncbi:NAD(P)-binding protein [Macrolepiota fuliginosa MF-IS2]|uniref:NAD(P)-binding protein n=1 Tax=Macrolepiota fuliginosa MF-IS2 TaxID=1400762 RepID=A0A9P5XIX4_9AGAR|nr:NAD(P)-binding protein [Macrolepiota fuliginosa MF-IS2]
MASQAVPDVQKAWLVTRQGKPSRSLKLELNLPVPKKLKAGEVLLRVQAGALNPVGWKLMKMLPNFIARRPHIAEHDLAGVIIDSNGTQFKNGDEVFGWIPTTLTMKTGQGALGEFARVPADHLVIRPPNVTPVQAAGITLAGLTAYQALHGIAKVEADQTVFIRGGSTAVGAFAIQLAKAAGAKVIATASGKNESFVRDLGADEFIDYTKVDLSMHLTERSPSPKFNIIFDAVGSTDSSLYTSSEAYLAPNGIFVTTGPLPQNSSMLEIWKLVKSLGVLIIPRWLGGTKRTYRYFGRSFPVYGGSDRSRIVGVVNKNEDLQALRALVDNGSVRPIVDSVFEFDDVPKAYERIMTTRSTGKVVVKVDPTVN